MSRWWSKNSAKVVHQRLGQDLKFVIIRQKYILEFISSSKFGELPWGAFDLFLNVYSAEVHIGTVSEHVDTIL